MPDAASPKEVSSRLPNSHARILQGYWALYQNLPPEELGSEEILAWLDRSFPELKQQKQFPSLTLVTTVLIGHNLEHRGPGRPKGSGWARHNALSGSPLLPPARFPKE
jgi:hypothetical protein